jgi:hypothetical protein
LDGEYKGRVRSLNLDATTDENRKIVHALGFDNHGIVIRSAAGEVLWKQADHDVKMEDVRRELDRVPTKQVWRCASLMS